MRGPSADTGYPQLDGPIGNFGYDVREGGRLVPPGRPGLMFQSSPPWIGDRHLHGALAPASDTQGIGSKDDDTAAAGGERVRT